MVCGVVSRTRCRKGKKKRVLSLSLRGCCVQCNLIKNWKGPMQNSQSVEKFPLGGFGAGRPFLIVGNSLARLSGRVCVVAKSQQHQQSRLQVCQSAGTVRCGTVRYGTVRHSTVRPSIAQYPPSSACPGGWFWYGKYLAGQPGRLLDQVLISLAGLVNLKRKSPKTPRHHRRDEWSP